jgi:hypothetical protein
MPDKALLLSAKTFKDRTAVHGNVDESMIVPDILYVQDLYLLPILGTALFNKVSLLVSNDQILDPGNANYKTLLDSYIIDTLVYYTLSELPQSMGIQFWNRGVLRKEGDTTSSASMSELLDLAARYKHRAEYYANRLKLYLIDKSPTLFQEYLNAGSTIDAVTPEQLTFTMPIFLGDEGNPYCNKGGFNGQPYSE